MKQHAAEIGKIDPIVQPFSPVWGLVTAGEFDLEPTLESGQSFQWARDDQGWHIGWVKGRLYRVHQHTGSVFFSSPEPGDPHELSDYLQSDFDTGPIRKYFLQLDPFLRNAVAFSPGLRILKQDPWECLAGFILSSSKQVAHIKQIWAQLCERYGESIEWQGRWFHRFPPPEVIALLQEHQLRDCKMGFRAVYLLRAARAVASGAIRLDLPAELSTREARAYLTRLVGVGDKIADCVLLYAYQKWDAFPRDVWINRVLQRIYFRKKSKVSSDSMIAFIRDYFGPYAGYAQQYLFHYVRLNPKVLK